jgi:hypothetical protein
VLSNQQRTQGSRVLQAGSYEGANKETNTGAGQGHDDEAKNDEYQAVELTRIELNGPVYLDMSERLNSMSHFSLQNMYTNMHNTRKQQPPPNAHSQFNKPDGVI